MSVSATTSSSVEPFGAAERHLVASVQKARLASDPFPYFYAQKIFPIAFYEEMRRQIPDRALYKGLNETGRAVGYDERLILPLNDRSSAVPAAQRAFWDGVVRLLVGSAFATAIVSKFAQGFLKTMGKDPRQLQYRTELMLVKDLDGYAIGPHTDVKNRAVSIMFYMPSSPRHEQYGTAIYRPNDPSFRSDGSEHFDFDEFTRLKTMPCRANSMFAFHRNDVSFHGVEPIRDPECERDVLLYILRWRDPTRG